MEDDLRGLDLRTEVRGTKRSRDELSDGSESDDEPTPKRDKLLEELCDLQSKANAEAGMAMPEDTESEEAVPVQHGQSQRSHHRNWDLPLRGLWNVNDARRNETGSQELDAGRRPGGSSTEAKLEVSRDRGRDPSTNP